MLARIGFLTILLLLVLVLAACSNSKRQEVEETPEKQTGQIDQSEQTEPLISNYYMSLTNGQGSIDDGAYFAAGFMGFVEDKYFEELSNDYGYKHLSKLPVWADCGGDEMWVVIPKYEDSEIIVRAAKDINLDSGLSFKAGDEIVRASEALLLFADSKDGKSNIEITVKTSRSTYSLKPVTSFEGDQIHLPDNIWNISEYKARKEDKTEILGDWRWEGENGQALKLSISESKNGNDTGDSYFMAVESIYPGRDPGLGGPFGGSLEVDGNKASYNLSSSEGKALTDFEYQVEGDSLILRFIGGDPFFSLISKGDSISFKATDYFNKKDPESSAQPAIAIAYESYVETIGVNGIYTGDAPERVASVLGEPLEKPFGDTRYDYDYEDGAYEEKIMVVFADYGVKYIQATTKTENGKLLSEDFLDEFQGGVYRAREELALEMDLLSSLAFVANDDSVLVVEKRIDDSGEINRAYMVQSIYDWTVSRGWNNELFADENKFIKVDGLRAIEDQ